MAFLHGHRLAAWRTWLGHAVTTGALLCTNCGDTTEPREPESPGDRAYPIQGGTPVCRSEVVMFRQLACEPNAPDCGDSESPWWAGPYKACTGVMIAPNIALTARHCDLNAPYVWHWSGELQIDSVGQLEDLVISGDMRQQVRAVYPAPDRDVAVVEFDSAQPGGFALVSSMESAGWWRNFESSGAAGGYECRTNYVGLFGGWVSDETDDFGPLTKLFSTNAGLDIEPGDSGGPAFWVDDAGAMRVVGVVHGPGGPVLFPSFQYDVFSYVGDFTPACAMVSRESCVAQPLCAWYECTESCQAAGTPIEAVCGCRDQTTLEGCNEAGRGGVRLVRVRQRLLAQGQPPRPGLPRLRRQRHARGVQRRQALLRLVLRRNLPERGDITRRRVRRPRPDRPRRLPSARQ